ncbi:MAG: hypothetical protein JOZ95_01740 [Solirubrobacterales bacterium]|nr:hypothetical protein [Solirubrobacterales bacterium]
MTVVGEDLPGRAWALSRTGPTRLVATADRRYPRGRENKGVVASRAAQLRLPDGASVLAHEGRDQFAAQTLFTITSLLDLPISAQLQAALYRAAALVSGARYDGTTYELSHRAGVGISVGGIQLSFNAATSALLGQGLPGPGGETRTAVLATGIRDTINARPETH